METTYKRSDGKIVKMFDKPMVNAFDRSATKKSLKQASKSEKIQKQEKKDVKTAKDKPKTQAKSRFMAGVVYPESLPDNWIGKVKSLGYAGEVSPCHDQDLQLNDFTDPNGPIQKQKRMGLESVYKMLMLWKEKPEHVASPTMDSDKVHLRRVILKSFNEWTKTLPSELEHWQVIQRFANYVQTILNPIMMRAHEQKFQILKKAHYHWILILDKPITSKTLMRRLQKVLGEKAVSFKLIQPITTSVQQVHEYLTHRSLSAVQAHKHLYNEEDIIAFNGFDIRNFISYSPEQKKYCLTCFGNLALIARKMKDFGEDYLELDNLYKSELRMSDPETLLIYLTRYAKPLLDSQIKQKQLTNYKKEFQTKLNDLDKPEKTGTQKSETEQIIKPKDKREELTQKIMLADRALQTEVKHEREIHKFGRTVQSNFEDAEARQVLRMIEFLVNAISERKDWPTHELFMRSYISYRNFYRDYMEINKK